jgi:hypothetical protein
VGLASPAWAGPFSFLRKNKQPAQTAPTAPAQPQVPELIQTLKADPDAGKRAAAAEELRQHDTKAYPEIIPVLIEAAQRDAKPEVRLSAVQSLGRIRPVSAEVGRVIEQVVSSDTAMRVRLTARTTLAQYQMAGYRSGQAPAGPAQPGSTNEPPLAEPQDGPALNPPPLPPPVVDVPPSPQPYAQPLPKGPALYPAQPSVAPQPPTPSRLSPTPNPRPSPTSQHGPADGPPLPGGTPLSNYRLIQPPQRFPDNVIAPPVVPPPAPEPVSTQPAPSKPVPATPVSMPVVKPAPVESGPMLNAPQ